MKRLFILQALFVVITTIILNVTLSAQDTLMVTNTNDSGAGSLRQAIADAPYYGNSTITFSDVIFFDTIKVNSYITLNKNLTILGPGPDTLAISGENSTQVFQINRNSRYFSISDLTFTKSTKSAIKVIEGYLSINDCNFIGNNSSSYGGALYVEENCNLTLNNCLFSQNKAAYMGGGAIYLGYWTGNVYINNCTFTDNEATVNTNGGGAVYINGPTVYFEGCTFSGNISAKQGGAIYSYNVHTHVTNCIFTNNSANGGGGVGGGGAIYYYKKALTCKNSIFTSNSANSIGGAIYNRGYNGSPYIQNYVSLINCSFTGNHSNSNGGAIYNFFSTGEIINCIISGNTATYDNNEMFGSNIDISYNCINECYDDNGNWDSDLGNEGTGNIDADPLFISPPANLHIQENSPCIDAGIDENYTPDTDLEGNLRDENPDIGAYEYCVPPIIDAAWNGSENNDWNNTANWSNTLTPNEYTNVTIPATLHNPTINNYVSAPAKTNNLTIMAGAVLTLQPGKCLTTEGTLTNSGTMLLQSDATGTASLITNSDVIGNYTIEKYITDSQWHLIGSPMTSLTAEPFYGDYVQYYAGGEWVEVTNVDDPIYPLVGYSLWDVAKHTTYTFNGTPNNGELSIPVTSAHSGWNLLANPYPSPVDWDLMDDTYGAIYYWEPTAGNYVNWNNGVGSGNPILPAMQGFWINSASDVMFTIDNEVRTHSNTDVYYKKESKESDPKLELIAFNESRQDHFHFLFTEDATENFDLKYDAYKMLTNVDDVPQLFSISNDKRYSIDRRPTCESINLGFSCMTSGEFSIMLAEKQLIPKAILEDTKTGTFNDLTAGAYSFAYLTDDNKDRFILHFGTVGIENMQTNVANIYAYQKKITIANLESNEEVLLSVYNTAGAEVLSHTLNGALKHVISTTLPSGIYVAVLRSNSEVIKRKINIQ